MKLTAPAAALVAAWLLAGSARAEDEWIDGVRQRLEERVQGIEAAARDEAAPPTTPEAVRWALDHGEVRFVGGLARVDVTLEVRNQGGPPEFEWARRFEVDPRAAVVAARLLRPGAPPISCRTLTLEDARRIYQETRTGPPRTTPQFPGRDPLRLERTSPNRLDVVVFPVNPGETVRVEITFVTPLRARGSDRVYVDPLGRSVHAGEGPALPRLPAIETDLTIHAGALTFASASPDLVPAGSASGVLRFTAPADRPRPTSIETGDDWTTVSFRVPRDASQAVAVRGGGLGTRVASWWFDPARTLSLRGLPVREGVTLRLRPLSGSSSRIAPNVFDATAEAGPVSGRLHPGGADLCYAVEVLDGDALLDRFEAAVPVDRVRLDERMEDALTAWHRACLVERVFEWAGADPVRTGDALSYAVDAGVLVPGTAALAIPRGERTLLSLTSRRTYDLDGAVLGAPNGEADLRAPPSSVR